MDMNKNECEDLENHLNTLEEEIKNLANKLDAFHDSLKEDRKKQNELFRNKMDRLLDGTEENPGILKSLNNIVQILDERLPKPEK